MTLCRGPPQHTAAAKVASSCLGQPTTLETLSDVCVCRCCGCVMCDIFPSSPPRQAGGTTPLRPGSDVAMSSLSGTEGAAPLPPAAEEGHDSAFMMQHPYDNVQRRLHESEVLESLRHPSDTSDANTAAGAAALAAAAAAAAAAGAAGAGGEANGHKRSRGVVGEEEELTGGVGPRGLYHRESEWVCCRGGGGGGRQVVVVREGRGGKVRVVIRGSGGWGFNRGTVGLWQWFEVTPPRSCIHAHVHVCRGGGRCRCWSPCWWEWDSPKHPSSF